MMTARPAANRAIFSFRRLGYWLMALDALVCALAGLASAHDLLSYTGHSELLDMYLAAIGGGTALLVTNFKLMRIYEFAHVQETAPPLRRLIPATALTLFSVTAIAFALRMDFLDFPFARSWLMGWFVITGVAILIVRVAMRTAILRMSRNGRLRRNVAILGAGQRTGRMVEALTGGREPWNNLVGVFDDRHVARDTDAAGPQLAGSTEELIAQVRANMVDDIVLALPWSAHARLVELVTRLHELPVEIHVGSGLASFVFPQSHFERLSGLAVLDVVRNPLSGWRAVLKAIEDRIGAAILIVALSPLLALIAVAVKLDSPGPLIFRQPRYGFNNQVFGLYKFRSMYHNRPPETGTPQATKNDPRVTRVGRFIRRTSLDELPQLFNVLDGTMSLVGPRPHAVDHNRIYGGLIDSYFARHRMKPGITGWAQVNGLRGETDTTAKMEARVKYDLEYIENWSVWFDLRILVQTVLVILFQKTAY
jgi:Undecaprenyl-phosphate glucose phosphotransferase